MMPAEPAVADAAVERVSELMGEIVIGEEWHGPTGPPVALGPPAPTPAVEPPFVSQFPDKVNFNHKWKLRTKWLELARKAEKDGELSPYDIHILKWFLVGDEVVFYPKGFQELWDVVSDENKLNMMLNHSVD